LVNAHHDLCSQAAAAAAAAAAATTASGPPLATPHRAPTMPPIIRATSEPFLLE